MLIQDDIMKKENSLDNRGEKRASQAGPLAPPLSIDVINTSQNENILIDTPTGKTYI
jgi:hypothetical protein